MNINTNKTRILISGENSKIWVNIYLDSQVLTQVHKFKYLGNRITSDGKSTEEKIKELHKPNQHLLRLIKNNNMN